MARKRGSKSEPYESTVQGAFDDAKSEIESLSEEICEWRDNMEGAGMESVPKYEEVSEAAEALEEAYSTLESLDLGELADEAENAPVTTTQDTRKKAMSRAGRAGNAGALLYAAKEALEDFVGRDLSFMKQGLTEEECDALDSAAEEAQSAAEEISIAIDALEGVCFPGMF
jgi:hypothetical protein